MKTTRISGIVAWTAATLLAGAVACGGGTVPGGGDPGGPDASADGSSIDAMPDDAGDVPADRLGDDVPGDGTLTDVPGDAPAEASDSDPGPDVLPCDAAEPIAAGSKWLSSGESGFATTEFEKAVALCPDDVQARFGAGLSHLIYGAEQFVSVMTVLSGQGTGPKLPSILPLAGDGAPESQNDWLAFQLHTIFVGLRGHFATAIGHLDAIGDADVVFEVADVPVFLGIQPTFLFDGRMDRGDLLLMRAVGSLVTGLLDVFAGQDWHTDVLSLVSMGRDVFEGGSGVDYAVISKFAAYLLNEDDRFLGLDPDTGAGLFADARDRLAAVGPNLLAAVDAVRAAGNGDERITFVEDEGKTAFLNVRWRLVPDEDGNIVQQAWRIGISEKTRKALLDASESIGTPGKRVTLHGCVNPLLAMVVVGFIRAGILDAFGLKLPIELPLDLLEVDDVDALLAVLLPNVLAFDWGTYFLSPAGLRAWLPGTTTDAPILANTLAAQWECPDDLAADGFPGGYKRLYCSTDAVLTDSAHFVGTAWETPADGEGKDHPVFGFADPTLKGLAYVNLDGKTGDADPTAYVLADRATLNSALGRLLAGILSLLK